MATAGVCEDAGNGGDTTCPIVGPPRPRTSSLHYFYLNGTTLKPLEGVHGMMRRLPLPSPPSPQLLVGPEDGRLFEFNGHACVIYNDVLPERNRLPGSAVDAARAARFRVRRGIYLACLDSGSTRELQYRKPLQFNPPIRPILLRLSDEVLRLAGAISDIEKNWVPFEYNGTLYVSYSLDPHVVLRLPQEELNAALVKSMAPKQQEEEDGKKKKKRRKKAGGSGGEKVLEVYAELAYATRFEEAPNGEGDVPRAIQFDVNESSLRPMLRGGTPPILLDANKRTGEPPSFLGMMHTVLKRKGQSMYTVAAYTFSATPPFQITGISRPFGLGGLPTPYPINLVQSSADRRELLLSYGTDDTDWRIARLKRKDLIKSLVPVRTEPLPETEKPPAAVLPTRLHFVTGTPPEVRTQVVADIKLVNQHLQMMAQDGETSSLDEARARYGT